MPEPIVFISTHRIKEGQLDGFKQFARATTPLIEAGKPQTVFFQAYLNTDGNEVTIVHVFGDADAMDLHFQGADERSAKAYDFIEPLHFEICGTPSDEVLTAMRQEATRLGVGLTLKPQPLVGFTRFASR